MIVAFPGVHVACFLSLATVLASLSCFCHNSTSIFQIMESPLHSSERLFQFVLVLDRRFDTRLQHISATAFADKYF